MQQSLDEFFEEYRKLSDGLAPYCDRMTSKIYPDGTPKEMSEHERVFYDLYFYWSAALVNSGDIFGYLPFIMEHQDDFAAIGATGTIKALTGLMPFYREQQALKYEDQKGQYWWRTRDERASVEALAEDTLEFARLLLSYAKKSLPFHESA